MAELNPIGKLIHERKYARKDADGTVETWEQTCLRVAINIAYAYHDHYKVTEETHEEEQRKIDVFYNMINELVFIPGGRILANAGTDIKNLNNCFVLPVEDSRKSIYESLGNAAEIFAWGGGLGYNFSNLREEGAPISTTGGQASGPLSFMGLFDNTGEVIQQASRRGAQMGVLDIDHPDIDAFIHFKSEANPKNVRLLRAYKDHLRKARKATDGKMYFDILEKTLVDDQLTHFNISVGITDEFMQAVVDDKDWDLISRVDGSVTSTYNARELLYAIAEQSWASGDPGVLFLDRANEDNMVKYLGDLGVTNPCVGGDTLIMTVLDGARPIRELAEDGYDVLVYTWNPETKLPEVGIMTNIRKTREHVDVLEVTFDSGLKVLCTPDHNFFTMRGQKVQAQDLEVGRSVRAYKGEVHRDGHVRVHGWADGKVQHQYTARLVYEYFYGPIPEGHIIHHRNMIENDNDPENLEALTKAMHNSVHYAERSRSGFGNHKVVSVEEMATADVYNGVVEGTHSYIIADPDATTDFFTGIVSANCGEVPLLDYEPCCLGSINLHKMYDAGTNDVNWEFLEYIVRNAVTFLDSVQELSETPIDEINHWAKGLRRIGLGVMGWADLLAELEIPYNSDEALELARHVSWFITYFAYLQSVSLAIDHGAFDMYDREKVDLRTVDRILNCPEYAPREIDINEISKLGFRVRLS
jgi:ribonucleotide reductase alpha subunit